MITILAAILRHALTMGGGALMAQGTITADDVNSLAGAIVTVGGVVWSLFDKRK